jgi:thiol:disulfide interchange protein DsbD
VRASLVAEDAWAQPGQSLTLVIRLQTDAGWHTYWRNPGDSGLPTRVKWDLPAGLTAGPLLWPVPERFGAAPVVSYGYAGDVLLLSRLDLSPGVPPGTTLRIGATVQWLECQEICRPGRSEVALEIPVRHERPAGGAAASLFARARERLPAAPAGWTLRADAQPRSLRLSFRAPRSVPVERAHFYPGERSLLDHAAPQALELAGGTHTLTLPLDLNRRGPVARLAGVLVTEGRGATRAIEIDVPLQGAGD